jgi:hypothetical protein
MGIDQIKEASWMYMLGAFVTLFIIVGALIFGFMAYRRSKELGMEKETLRKTIVSSMSFSVLPSIGIFIGVITMAGLLGLPLPWIRLTVVGALHYELMAVSVAADGITAQAMTTQQFVTIAFVMTLSIIWGGLFALFFFKKYQAKVIDKATTGSKGGFGAVIFDAVFIGMILAFFGSAFAKMIRYETRLIENGTFVIDDHGNYVYEDQTTFVPVLVFLVSMVSMAAIDWLIKRTRWRWLENFQLSLSMIIGMMTAVLLGLGGVY